MLAEDNAINQQVAARMLQRLGYRVDLAVTGREAVAAAARGSYAAVLMDCQMPEMDGYEATAAIRAHEGRIGRTPIIAMTANALQGDRERCLAAGMDDYIAKPVTSDQLAAVLERWTAGTPSASDGAPAGAGEAAPAAAIDERVLASLGELQEEGEPDLVRALIEQFLSDAPRRLAALRAALLQADAHAVEQAAHALKGSCSNFGARPMASLCEELQALGRANALTPASTVLARLEAEFERVRTALAAEVAKV